jgi:hypothetical protein
MAKMPNRTASISLYPQFIFLFFRNFQRMKENIMLPAVTADILRIMLNITDHPKLIKDYA